jgi:hypothetical protein
MHLPIHRPLKFQNPPSIEGAEYNNKEHAEALLRRS